MSSPHSPACSTDGDFFDNGTLNARTDTRVISRTQESSDQEDYTEDDDFHRSTNHSPSTRSGSRRTTAEKSESKSSQGTLTPISRSRQSSSIRSFTELHSSVGKSYNAGIYGSGNLRKKTAGSRASRYGQKYGEKPAKRSPVVQVMLSSKQQEINDLLNKLSNTKLELASAEKENKLLKKLQTRHDKEIRQFEKTRKELPEYLAKNSEDQHTLKLQLRKTQETKRSLESRLHQNFEEMKKMEGVLSRLKKLVYDKSLGERSELSKQLVDTESDLEKAQQKIKDLDKKIASKVSSYTKQLKVEKKKHQQTLRKLQEMEMDYLHTNSTLKERERALQKGNIYAFRKRDINEKAILPLTTSTPKLPLPAIPRSRSPSKATPKINNDCKSLEQDRPMNNNVASVATSKSHNSKPTAKVFLTADFDSPMTSPSNSFLVESQPMEKEAESSKPNDIDKKQFANDLERTEEEIKKLQASVEQKASLLAKLREIDRTTPRNPEILKSRFEDDIFSPTTSSQSGPSTNLNRRHDPTYLNTTNPFPEKKNDLIGSNSSNHQGSSRRPLPSKRSSDVLLHANDQSDTDEPLFDLSTGKNNRKPDLLTQLFGNQK